MATIFILTQNEPWENPLKQGIFLTLEGAQRFANEHWKSRFKGMADDPDFEEVEAPPSHTHLIAPTRKWESDRCGLLGTDWLAIEEFEVTGGSFLIVGVSEEQDGGVK